MAVFLARLLGAVPYQEAGVAGELVVGVGDDLDDVAAQFVVIGCHGSASHFCRGFVGDCNIQHRTGIPIVLGQTEAPSGGPLNSSKLVRLGGTRACLPNPEALSGLNCIETAADDAPAVELTGAELDSN
jgi:hypothetical protein